jgi:uncharacterized protein (DUF934 family)
MTNAARMKILTPLDHAESGALNVVQLANDDDPFTLKDGIAGIDRIELHFPHFTDGRAYSQAYLLRRRLGFRGDLRGTGFSSAVLKEGVDPADAAREFERFPAFYQTDLSGAV